MTITEVIGLIADVVTVLAVVIGGVMAVFVYFQLAPVLQLRILPRWSDESKQHLVLRFEIENKSRVRMNSPWGQIQVLKHRVEPAGSLSHWVPFEKGKIKPDEVPIEWLDPVKIFGTTKEIYPGQTIAFEMLYHCPEDSVVMHIGLQVGLALDFWERIITGKGAPWRQTTTCFVVK
jgi:hypothetical protein